MKSPPLDDFPFADYKIDSQAYTRRVPDTTHWSKEKKDELESQRHKMLKMMMLGHLPVPPEYARDAYEDQLKKFNITRVLWENLAVREEATDTAVISGRKAVIYNKTIYHPAFFNVLFSKVPKDATD